MNTGTVIFYIFVLYTVILGICTFRIMKRAKIINSIWDIVYNRKDFHKKMKTIKWNVSDFLTIDPNDLMLRFVTFSQKRKYYIFFAWVALINTYK